ncbi:MAG: ribosome maturation factor RimM [Bacilli bacterium]|nr:ribosome maturation factor RimM [Bacilli bacterium]
MYLIGKIVGVHGLKGELKVKADTDFDRFKVGSPLYLKKGETYQKMEVSSHRTHKGLDLITLDGLKDINTVLELVGQDLFTPHGSDKLKDNEFYYENLIGKLVETEEGTSLGVVRDLREVPQGIILEIDYHGRIGLIPFVDEFVLDVKEDTIIVRLIEGLL